MRIWAVALVMLCLAWPAARAETLAAGAVVEGVLAVAGKQVPLPEGQWIVTGVGHVRWEAPVAGAYGAIANIVLFQLRGPVVDKVLELNVNELAVTDGWGIAADCTRRDLALAVVKYRTGWDTSCFFVTHTLAISANPTPAWRQSLQFAVDADLIVAPLWLSTGFRVANRRDVIDARFHVSPTMRGVPVEAPATWADSAWYGERLSRDPRRAALGSAAARWAAFYSTLLEAGLKNRLDMNLVAPEPGDLVADPAASELARRIAGLSEQRRAGRLGEAQFLRQVAWLHEHGIRPGSETVDPSTAALLKSLTFRPLVAAGSLAMAVVGLGPAAAGGAMSIIQAGVDTTVFYLHELGWDRLLGKPRRDSARTMDFTYYGTRT